MGKVVEGRARLSDGSEAWSLVTGHWVVSAQDLAKIRKKQWEVQQWSVTHLTDLGWIIARKL